MIHEQPSPERFFDVNVTKLEGDYAYIAFGEFTRKLWKEQDKEYLSFDVGEDSGRVLCYVAKLDGEAVGVAIGFERETHFNGSQFIIDPKYRGSNVGRSIIDAIKAGHAEIEIEANPIEWEHGATADDRLRAKQALVAYYRSLDFHPHSGTSPDNILIWKRDAKKKS